MATYTIMSHNGTGKCLNIASSANITNGTNVNIYTASGSNDQKWDIINLTSANSEQYIAHFSNINFGLNAYRSGTNWNCTLYNKASGNNDGLLYLKPTGTSGVYNICLSKHSNRYLTAEGTGNGANVSWQAQNNGTSQNWKITAVGTSSSQSTYSKVTTGGFNLHIIETAPSNITLKNIQRTAVKNSGQYGVNGAFFTTNGPSNDYVFYNVATENGVALGPHSSGEANGSGGASKVGRGVIAYHNDALKMFDPAIRANETQALLGSTTATWMQGGVGMFLGDSNWKNSDKWYFDLAPSSVSSKRTAMVVNTSTKKVFLIVGLTTDGSSKSIEAFRNALKTHFGISDSANGTSVFKGLLLDGGESSSMRAMANGGSQSFGGTRAINEMICLKQV